MAINVEAPMVGKILRVEKNVGDHVEEDEVVVVMEAMKMEIPVVAPRVLGQELRREAAPMLRTFRLRLTRAVFNGPPSGRA